MRGGSPIGVVLAGGRGLRLGGAKLIVPLRGRPLVAYPLAAMRAALDEVALITKPDVELPDLPGTTVWIEPAEPRHPLVGIVEALSLADGRPIVTCPADLPFVGADLLRRLAAASPAGSSGYGGSRAGGGARLATIVRGPDGRLHPLLGRFEPEAAVRLAGAAAGGRSRVLDVISDLGVGVVDVDDPDALFNVNDPEDLIVARAMLDRLDSRH